VNIERVQRLIQELQNELGVQVAGNGTLTLNFQNGTLQAVSVLAHVRLVHGERRSSVDKPPAADAHSLNRR
jgi:hypothetical protein